MRAKEDPRFSCLSADQKLQVDMVLRGLLSVDKMLTYVSMPVTSGKRAYDVCREHGLSSVEALRANPELLYTSVISHNRSKGLALAEAVKERSQHPLVIPILFDGRPQKWSEPQYMYFWIQVIEEKILEHHFIEGWQYSTGCVEEFVTSVEMQAGRRHRRDILLFDHLGQPLRAPQGEKLIWDAMFDIKEGGFEVPEMIIAMYDKLTAFTTEFHLAEK